jgi:hypothetical protein
VRRKAETNEQAMTKIKIDKTEKAPSYNSWRSFMNLENW